MDKWMNDWIIEYANAHVVDDKKIKRKTRKEKLKWLFKI